VVRGPVAARGHGGGREEVRRLLAAASAALALAAAARELPPEVARALQPYREFRTHSLAAWHPLQRELMVMHRVGAEELAHRVAEPGSKPLPLPAIAGASHVAFQPTRGDLVVFIAPDADGVPRVQRYDASTQSAAMVSPPGERAIDVAWNPAGDRIVYSTADPGGRRSTLRMVDPRRPETERLLSRHDGTWTDLRVGANGQRIVASQLLPGGASHLWQVGVATGTARRVTRPDAKGPVSYRSPQFSRNGSSLFALSQRGSGARRLVLLPIAGGTERVLTAHLPHGVDAFAVSTDAGLLAFVANENGSHVMRFIDLVTLKEQPRPPLLDGVIGGLAWRPGSHEIAFHISSARTAGDVFSYDVKANQVTRWTNGNNPALNAREFPEPRLVRWKAADGRDLSALLYAPPRRFAGKRPVIVDHRFGPGSARAGFLGAGNYLVNELGIVLVRPGLRDARDVTGLLEWIGKEPGLDASKTVVIGEGRDGEPDDEVFLEAALDFAARAGP